MKLTINLLPPKPKKVRNGLSFYSLLTILFSLTLISAATFGFFWWEAHTLNQQIVMQKAENSTTLIRVAELEDVVAKRRLPRAREAIALELQQEIDAMIQLTQMTDELTTKDTQGFLSLIIGLQNNLPANTTLESYSMTSNGKLDFIKGQTDSVVNIPQYIETLRNRRYLIDQNIIEIRSLRDSERYSFELTFSTEDIQE